MRSHIWPGALAALAILGCGSNSVPDADPAFAKATPDFAGLSFQLVGDDGSASDGASQDALAEDAPQYLPMAQATVRPVNRIVAFVTRKIEALSAEKPVFVDSTKETWQKAIDGITWQLFVQRNKDSQGSYFVSLAGFPNGVTPSVDNNDAVTVAGCDMVVDKVVAHRGQGQLDIDLEKLHTLLGDSFTSSGRIQLRFNHENGNKRLRAKLTNLTTKSVPTPVNAVFAYTKAPDDKGGAIRVTAFANVNDPADSTKASPEWVLIQGRWVAGFKARFDTVAFSGDLPANGWARGVECFDTADKATYARLVFRDPSNPAEDQRTVVARSTGTVDACAEKLRTDPDPATMPDDFDAAKQVAADDENDLNAPNEVAPGSP